MAKSEEDSNPPYSEMILAAIASIGEKEGSNKKAIIQQIESTYRQTLPEDYASAISQTLSDLKQTDKLLFVNNLYIIPDLNPPSRRGCGRPKKPKQLTPQRVSNGKAKVAGEVAGRRGRPAKKKGSSDVKAAGGSFGVGGLPPKKRVAVLVAAGVKRGRGRPRKVKDWSD